jgi:hypothetical protein
MGLIGSVYAASQDNSPTHIQFSDGGYKKMYGDDKIHSKEFTQQVGNYIKQNQEKMVNGVGKADVKNQMETVQGNTNPIMQGINSQYGASNNNVFGSENYDALLNGQMNQAQNQLYNNAQINNQNYNLANDQLTKVAGNKVGIDIANAQMDTNASLQKNAQIGGITNGLVGNGLKLLSDRRAKENIRELCIVDGVKMYEFNYIGHKFKHIGVMAQDLLDTKYKDAVSMGSDGLYRVDYKDLPKKVIEGVINGTI